MFDERLKTLREARGVKRDVIAKEIGVSERAYISYELNQREANSSVLIALSKYFGVTIDYLLGNSVQTNTNCTELADRVALVISEYIKHPELQQSVDEILNVRKSEQVKIFKAAHSTNDEPPAIIEVPKSLIDKLENAPDSDDEL